MERIFNLVKKYGYQVRLNKIDGLGSWNKIKDILKVYSKKDCNWEIKLKIGSEITDNFEEIYDNIHNTLTMKG